MSYDGVVLNLDDLYLFIINPDTDKIMDGISISYHKCYDNLKKDQLMVVKVIFKDGTQEIESLDLEDFIYSDHDNHDVFLYITDVLLFSLGSKENKSITLEELINNGELNVVAHECIKNSKIKKEVKDE